MFGFSIESNPSWKWFSMWFYMQHGASHTGLMLREHTSLLTRHMFGSYQVNCIDIHPIYIWICSFLFVSEQSFPRSIEFISTVRSQKTRQPVLIVLSKSVCVCDDLLQWANCGWVCVARTFNMAHYIDGARLTLGDDNAALATQLSVGCFVLE